MPYQELKRLEAVNRFLNIQLNKQEEFEEIAQLAADICGVSSGLITLVGQDVEYLLAEDRFVPNSGRTDSFCHYVVESNAMMVVQDAKLDPNLKDYAAVTREAGIRFYAGAPLTTHDGHTLGSLCVIDQKPADLTELQREMLQNLARQVIQLLEFESNLYFLKEQYLSSKKLELKMSSFFNSTASSHVMLDRELNIICYNRAVEIFIKQAYGIDIHTGMNVKQFVDAVYMADFMEHCSQALAGASINRERLLTFAGVSSWYLISYDPARNNDGEIIGVSYHSRDVSKKMLSQHTALAQQRKLEQIAYLQSHEFRRPVATLKGLVNLLEMDGHHITYPLVGVIKNSINEIDDKIAEIVSFTNTRDSSV
jgi:hypothetical protein